MGSRPSVIREEDLKTVVCVGVTGAGKSTLCNAIAGQQFTGVSEGFKSGTSSALHCDFVREGLPLRVVDTVGFLSNCVTEEGFQWWVTSNETPEEERETRFQELAATSIFGIDVFLFVERYGRFTDESRRHFQAFVDLAGEEALKHTAVIFTHVANSKIQKALEGGDLPDGLQDMVGKVRCVVGVDSVHALKLAVKDVLKAVRTVVEQNDGVRYSSVALRASQVRREDLLRRIQALKHVGRREALKSLRWELVTGTRTHQEVLRAMEEAEAMEQPPPSSCPCCLEGVQKTYLRDALLRG